MLFAVEIGKISSQNVPRPHIHAQMEFILRNIPKIISKKYNSKDPLNFLLKKGTFQSTY